MKKKIQPVAIESPDFGQILDKIAAGINVENPNQKEIDRLLAELGLLPGTFLVIPGK